MVLLTVPDYIGITVNLASANTLYNLKTLVDAALLSSGKISPSMCSYLRITAYNGVTGTGENNADVQIGDASVTTTNRGYNLNAPVDTIQTASKEYRSNVNAINFGLMFAYTAGTNQKLDIEIGRF